MRSKHVDGGLPIFDGRVRKLAPAPLGPANGASERREPVLVALAGFGSGFQMVLQTEPGAAAGQHGITYRVRRTEYSF